MATPAKKSQTDARTDIQMDKQTMMIFQDSQQDGAPKREIPQRSCSFLLKKKLTKVKWETLKENSVMFVLFWSEEGSKYFKASQSIV